MSGNVRCQRYETRPWAGHTGPISTVLLLLLLTIAWRLTFGSLGEELYVPHERHACVLRVCGAGRRRQSRGQGTRERTRHVS